jgi:hypothetical protein
MRRLAGILLIALLAAVAVAPLAADLTMTTVTTIEGAMLAGASGGMTPKVVVRLSGTKSRMDVDMGDQTVSTVSDSATNQAYLLRHEEKTALLLQAAAGPADPSAPPPASVEASVTPTGQKREIEGLSCDEYAVKMKLDLASMAAGGAASLPPEAAGMLKGVTLNVSGSIWAAKDAPGAAEYAVFQKNASQLAAQMAQKPAGAAGSSIPAGMERLITGFHEAAGIPYLSELTTKLEGSGQLVALMQQMGEMKITGKVVSISTDPVSTDIFNVPEGYTILK